MKITIHQREHIYVADTESSHNYVCYYKFICQKCRRFVTTHKSVNSLIPSKLIRTARYAYLSKNKRHIVFVKAKNNKLHKVYPNEYCKYSDEDVIVRDIIK